MPRSTPNLLTAALMLPVPPIKRTFTLASFWILREITLCKIAHAPATVKDASMPRREMPEVRDQLTVISCQWGARSNWTTALVLLHPRPPNPDTWPRPSDRLPPRFDSGVFMLYFTGCCLHLVPSEERATVYRMARVSSEPNSMKKERQKCARFRL